MDWSLVWDFVVAVGLLYCVIYTFTDGWRASWWPWKRKDGR